MKFRFISSAVVLFTFSNFVHAQYQPKSAPLMTQWAKDVTPDNAHREYPRPQMERPEWVNLNGLWDYAITPKDEAGFPKKFQGKILVPFPVESALSGVMKTVGSANQVFYERSFRLPDSWKGRRIIVNFGAVDYDATVYINRKQVGRHAGGYDAFSFDITSGLRDDFNTISVCVLDPTNEGYQPRGKQHAKPSGGWYTPTTGIWQTVWIEAVPQNYIRSLKITPNIDSGELEVAVDGAGAKDFAATAFDGEQEIASAAGFGGKAVLKITDAKLWSPASPHLYTLRVRAGSDEVASYFGMRKISVGKDAAGITRIFLNNKPYFQHGPLDQGFWPDGLYTAPTDAALKYDIEVTKKLGFNMTRKHLKVEPDRWYYWCDKLGLLVWQDMPNGDKAVGSGKGELSRTKESADTFERELRAMIEGRQNHPSIVMWVPFNEGMGQYKTARITNLIKQLDPTRLVDSASGFNDYQTGDVVDIHAYPGPNAPAPEENRAAVLGDFGALNFPVEGHIFKRSKAQLRGFQDADSLTDAYVFLSNNLRLLTASNLSAAVYNQLTDVETETTGLMTYDRATIKPAEGRVAAAHQKLYGPPPQVMPLITIAKQAPTFWRFTTDQPAENWSALDFNDSWWNTEGSGFGADETPGATVTTKWNTSDIWMRKVFELQVSAFIEPQLLIHHIGDVEIYINGQLVATAPGATGDYVAIPLDARGKAALKPGRNTFAVHCKQASNGQYIDLGLIDLLPGEWMAATDTK